MAATGDAVRSAEPGTPLPEPLKPPSKTFKLNIYTMSSLFLPVWADGSLEVDP